MIDKIKPAEERIHPMALDDKSVWCNAYFDEVVELRAAYEALQKENENLAYRLNNAQDSAIKALEDNAAQEKRIADLEAATEYQDTCTDGGKCGAGGYCKDCIQEPTKDE